MQHDALKSIANRTIVATLLGVALTCGAGPVQAVAAGGVFVVGPDQEAYRLSQTAALDVEVRQALDATTSVLSNQFAVGVGWSKASIYIADNVDAPRILDALPRLFVTRPNVVFVAVPAEALRITFSAKGLAAVLPSRAASDLSYLDRFVRDARIMPKSIDIERNTDGVDVHINNPKKRQEYAERIRQLFRNDVTYSVSGPDEDLRISIQPSADQPTKEFGVFRPDIGPAGRLLLPEVIESKIRDAMSEPHDLMLRLGADGLLVLIPEPNEYPEFVDKLRRAFNSPDFSYTTSPAHLLTVTLVDSQHSPEGVTPEAIDAARAEMEAVVDPPPPPIITVATPNGLIVRAANPVHNANRTAIIRQRFAGRTDVLLSTLADQSLQISFTYPTLAAPTPAIGRLAENVRSCLQTIKVDATRVSIIASDRIAVDLPTDADMSAFRQWGFARCGFALRPVDVEAMGDIMERPPSEGDVRLPQADGKDLWVKPAVVISADMIQEAHSVFDQSGRPVISFTMTDEGGRRWAAFTDVNVGHRFAIVSDGVVINAPVIRMPITGGSSMITGNFTPESARALANSIAASGPQFPLKIIEERPAS